MKTKINLIYLAIIGLVLIFSFTSCGDDDGDTTPPQIRLTTPSEGAELVAGTNMELVLELVDDEMLKSYQVEIHDGFNGHTHGDGDDHDHSKSLKVAEETEPFFIQKTWNLSDKSVKITHSEILISENATPGKYHLLVKCIDASGNDNYVSRNIVIVDKDHDHDHEH